MRVVQKLIWDQGTDRMEHARMHIQYIYIYTYAHTHARLHRCASIFVYLHMGLCIHARTELHLWYVSQQTVTWLLSYACPHLSLHVLGMFDMSNLTTDGLSS